MMVSRDRLQGFVSESKYKSKSKSLMYANKIISKFNKLKTTLVWTSFLLNDTHDCDNF